MTVYMFKDFCQYVQDLIRLTSDIKEDGQLQSDAFLHRLLQSRDLLPTEPLTETKNISCLTATSTDLSV